MNEKQLFHRREFLQLLAAGTAGLVFAGCGPDTEEVKGSTKNEAKKDSVPAATEEKKPLTENVKYFRKGDPEYEELRHGHNKRFNKFPAVIALCLNTDGVSEAIKYAKENKLPV